MKTNLSLPEPETVRDYVRQRYGAIAEQAGAGCGCGASTGCCATPAAAEPAGACCGGTGDAGGSYGEQLGYTADELAVAADADLGLGCGNPLAIAGIQPGEVVVDLGSGAGFDCLLAARRLAGTGRVIGVDMTPAMVTKARANAARSGLTNVEFRLGEIEALPVADGVADLVISNCVVNLSPEKARVLGEAFRVLKPGGRLAIADIVATRALPESMRAKLAAIGACVGGAALVADVRSMLEAAGFVRIGIAPREGSRAMISQWTEDETAGEFVVSALITAIKPKA
ncbi:MAG: arsenite methyltransferase [Opitutaceae bacterium]|nr:arsenite methyltransferase [Opitutaceae bacterium]